jgi:peroxiredoxin
MRSRFPLLFSLALFASLARGDAAEPPASPAAGHSWHGETFNDGPRQKAELMGNTGPVVFPATTANPDAQKFINQGVGQLHGFWYFEAERSFRQAAALDPDCAIAYWGMAMANTNNHSRARGFVAEAVGKKGRAGRREALYIDALDAYYKADAQKDKERHEAYTKALERILYEFPNDLEAKAFLALQLWLNRDHHSPITSHLAVDALLRDVLAAEPMHPCHHYRIHLWDYERPQNAVDSAARCGQSAPAIAHMWHMSGHIFSDLMRYSDAAWQQEASARVDHAYMIRDRVLPDQIHNYAHNNEWLIRDLSHIGRVRDAIVLARNLIELPRHPKYNTVGNGKSAHYGRLRLFELLARFELWDELVALCHSPYLEPTELPAEQVARLRALGLAHLRKGDITRGIEIIRELEQRLKDGRHNYNLEDISGPAPPCVTAAAASAEDRPPEPPPMPDREEDGRLTPIQLAIDELKGNLAVEQGDYKPALPLLKKAGGVNPLYLARVEYLAGNRETALKEAREAVGQHKYQVQPLAALIELLWQAGERAEATERFGQLRELAGRADLDLPAFARLAPIAANLNLPADWRVPVPPANDVGDRPPLESLGPFVWHPSPAPEWELAESSGSRLSLSQYRGKPLVVIFYLGYQCLHCAEQLQAFAPMAKEFEEAGISIVAISSDDSSGLAKSIEAYKPGVFPFPLLADTDLATFKSYRAFDDFEDRPLHGTFFIDGAGLVRWHDISFEPFRDARFLLNEARRLLALSGTKPALPAEAAAGAAPAAAAAGSGSN